MSQTSTFSMLVMSKRSSTSRPSPRSMPAGDINVDSFFLLCHENIVTLDNNLSAGSEYLPISMHRTSANLFDSSISNRGCHKTTHLCLYTSHNRILQRSAALWLPAIPAGWTDFRPLNMPLKSRSKRLKIRWYH